MLSASARKYLRGPRGQGFLYVDGATLEQLDPPMLDGHAATWSSRDAYELMPDARRFENWERSFANILGMGEAIQLALDLGLEAIWEHVQERGARLRDRLATIPGVTVTDIGHVQSGIVTFTVDGVPADQIAAELSRQRINVTTSSRSSTRFDMEDRGLDKVVRSSVHYLTTDAEIDQLCGAVAGLS
jgi:selenocysteine lyase/cysteine desulfurase